jgi:hypothetical protein
MSINNEVTEARAFRKVCRREKLRDQMREVYDRVTRRVIRREGRPAEVTEVFKAYQRAIKMYDDALESWFNIHIAVSESPVSSCLKEWITTQESNRADNTAYDAWKDKESVISRFCIPNDDRVPF